MRPTSPISRHNARAKQVAIDRARRMELRGQPSRYAGGGGTSDHGVYVVRGGNVVAGAGIVGVNYSPTEITELPSAYDPSALPATIDGVGIVQHTTALTWHLLALWDGITDLPASLFAGVHVLCPTTVTVDVDGGGTATLLIPASVVA